MSYLKCVRLCVAGDKFLSLPVNFAHNKQLSLTILRSINGQARLACAHQILLKGREQFADNLIARLNVKQYSKLADEGDTVEEDTSAKLTAKWSWVIRGKFKVAAFDAEGNPAIAVQSTKSLYLHRHICSNCKTAYDHSHPYRSLKHPQHIKDCPQCKTFAPPDVEIR